MECKVIYASENTIHATVLIETLWNVKCDRDHGHDCYADVLIETLWNVKCCVNITLTLFFNVLIETLWNVKKDQGGMNDEPEPY